jgi:hypothetical protein
MGEPCESEPPHGDAMSMGYWPPLPRSNRVGSLIGNDHAKSRATICTLVGNQRVVNTIIIGVACRLIARSLDQAKQPDEDLALTGISMVHPYLDEVIVDIVCSQAGACHLSGPCLGAAILPSMHDSSTTVTNAKHRCSTPL